jgi:hypothetical protein
MAPSAAIGSRAFDHRIDGGNDNQRQQGRRHQAANAAAFGLLWAHRRGDANMRSAWICTRNDVLGNLAVLLSFPPPGRICRP